MSMARVHRPTRCSSLDCRAPATLNCDSWDRPFCGRRVIIVEWMRLYWACLLDAYAHPHADRVRVGGAGQDGGRRGRTRAPPGPSL